ncbi:hypothetical protein GCM10020000_33330 [Streptomyces olivoverticillatus]
MRKISADAGDHWAAMGDFNRTPDPLGPLLYDEPDAQVIRSGYRQGEAGPGGNPVRHGRGRLPSRRLPSGDAVLPGTAAAEHRLPVRGVTLRAVRLRGCPFYDVDTDWARQTLVAA